jgi:phosphate-selective porin OprO/OprP
MNRKKINLILIVLLGLAALPAAQAASLEERLNVLERKVEVQEEIETGKLKTGAGLAVGKDGFIIKTNDGTSQLKIRGYFQYDSRSFIDDTAVPQTSGFLVRRIRPSFEGTVGRYFDFKYVPDFSGSAVAVQDAYADVKFFPEFTFRAGKFAPPVGLERLQSSATTFFTENALPTNLVPNRDVGYEFYGSWWEGFINYELGVFNGVADGASGDTDLDDNKDVAARLFLQPFQAADFSWLQGLGFGYSVISGDRANTTQVAALRTPGQQQFFAYTGGTTALGNHSRYSPQFSYILGSLGVIGEYVLSTQGVKTGANVSSLSHSSWQLALGYVLTGEPQTLKGIKPFKDFDPANGNFGAFELTARVSELTIDPLTFPNFSTLATSAQTPPAATA